MRSCQQCSAVLTTNEIGISLRLLGRDGKNMRCRDCLAKELKVDPEDRRVKRIYILPKGKECHDRMHRVILSNEARMVQGFSEEEKELFAHLLSRAIENMSGNPCKTKHKEEGNQ